MDERDIQELVGDVRAGRLSRRSFVGAMAGLGLAAPLASQMLAAAGRAQAQTRPGFTPSNDFRNLPFWYREVSSSAHPNGRNWR